MKNDNNEFGKRDDFYYWLRDYVPSARLDGRQEWYATENLRCVHFDTAKFPTTNQELFTFERMWSAIRSKTFFAPDCHENYIPYVTLIPRAVVDWCSNRSLDEVHTRNVDAIAAFYALADGAEEYIEKDVCPLYLPLVKRRFKELREEFPQDDAASDESRRGFLASLPPWAVSSLTHGGEVHFWPSMGHKPWATRDWSPHWCIDFITYVIRSDDEEAYAWADALRRDGGKRLDHNKKVQGLARQKDRLDRCEGDRGAFNYLMYARHRKESWTKPIGSDARTEYGVIYLLEDAQGRVKIGWTEKHPKGRLAACQTGNADRLILLGTVPGSRELEAALHAHYTCLKVRSDRTEWFHLKPSDVVDILSGKVLP